MLRLHRITAHLGVTPLSSSASSSSSSSTASSAATSTSIGTLLVHADKSIEDSPDLAPALHLATTYTAGNAAGLSYSRKDTVTRRRVEVILAALESGDQKAGHSTPTAAALTYASGMAAAMAILSVVNPKQMVLSKGYHMSTVLFEDFASKHGLKITLLDDFLASPSSYGKIDLFWVESPNNPYAKVLDLAAIAVLAHQHGAIFAVDGTMASPLAQQPLKLGVDVVMHSCTKYFGGHSDILAGALICRPGPFYDALARDRHLTGATPGNLESWLLLRSLRTFSLRVTRQCRTAEQLAFWLDKHPRVTRVWHPSLPSHPSHAIAKATLKLPPACFAFEVATKDQASKLASKMKIADSATSLGGVETLVEWRYQYDTSLPVGLVRLSVGLEDFEDLSADLNQALLA